MSADDHLSSGQFGPYYHASDHTLKTGAELTPQGAFEATGKLPVHGAVWYSSNPDEARNFGNHLYEVAPHTYAGDPVTEHKQGMGPGHFYTQGSLHVKREV